MSEMSDCNSDPGDGSIETTATLPEGAIPVRAIEVVQYLHPEGGMAHYVRWQGTGDIVAELGMLEYAKFQVYTVREGDQ